MKLLGNARFLLLLLAAPVGACDPSSDSGPQGVADPVGYAVTANDYESTSVSLLDTDGTVISDNFIHSGSTTMGLTSPLSGDVVLPSVGDGDPTHLTLIDRYSTDVITQVDTSSGEVLWQIKVKRSNAENDGVAFAANPQDMVFMEDQLAWVSRHTPNESVDDDDIDRGLDLVEVDLEAQELTGKRISLWSLNEEVDRESEDGEIDQVTAYARPAKMVRIGSDPNQVVVGIVSLSNGFDAVGPGMVALVDLKTEEISALQLPEMTNCGDVVPVPDDQDRVIVACIGFYRGDQRGTSGLASLVLRDGALEIEQTWHVADSEDSPMAVNGVVALGGDQVVAAATGLAAVVDDQDEEVEAATNDTMYVVDISSGETTELFQASGQYVIGSGAYNAVEGLLFVPDASTDGDSKPSAGVRVFERDEEEEEFTERETIEVDPLLPARQVRAL